MYEWRCVPNQQCLICGAPCRVSRVRQFAAVLHKNYLLQTRASRTWARFGVSGWLSLLLEILVPGVFFALMCIPKHYLNPQFIPRQLSPAYDLDLAKWGLDYAGMAAHTHPSVATSIRQNLTLSCLTSTL